MMPVFFFDCGSPNAFYMFFFNESKVGLNRNFEETEIVVKPACIPCDCQHFVHMCNSISVLKHSKHVCMVV